jgi:histidinol-phosphate aminotransferase
MKSSLPDVAPYIQSLVPYVPGKPIEETQRELGLKKVVKLASNENPLGPSPRSIKRLARNARELHRYPDAAAYRLKQALAKHLGLDSTWISVGNGSNELIDLLVRAYCVPGDAIVTHQAAFVAYRISAQAHGVRTVESHVDPLTLTVDLGDLLGTLEKEPRAKMVFLANPNNPTGRYVGERALREFLQKASQIRNGKLLIVLDYAYWEYVTAGDLPSPESLLREFPQVVILRTFSKVYGLAGLRVGYACARPEILQSCEKIRMPFNLNSLALTAAEESLGDLAFVKKARKVNADGMKLWEKSLKAMEIPYLPSQGNFLLINTRLGLGKSGFEVFDACLKKGVIFRPVANYGLSDYLRISIGTAAENQFAIKVLKELKK